MFWRTYIALLLSFLLDLLSPFFNNIFSFFPFVLCVIPSDFLPSFLSFSRALFFFFQLSEFLFSPTEDSQGCVPVCPSYIPWLRVFLCLFIVFLLHFLPVFLSNLPTAFSFLFTFMCNTHMKNLFLWQKARLYSSCPWLLVLASAMDFWGKISGLSCWKWFLAKRCETVRVSQWMIVIRYSKKGVTKPMREGLCRKKFLWDLSDIKQIERGCLTEAGNVEQKKEVFWDLMQSLLSVIQKYLDCISK